MCIPKWLIGTISTVITAVILGLGAWIFNANATISSMKKDDVACMDKYNTFDQNYGKALEKMDKRLDRIESKLDRALK